MRLTVAVLPMQWAVPLMRLGEPTRIMNRRVRPLSLPQLATLEATASASGPGRWITCVRRSAMPPITLSHDTRSQPPSPRAPVRRSGWISRSGCARDLGAWAPFMQITSMNSGWSRRVTLVTWPSRIFTAMGQKPSPLVQTRLRVVSTAASMGLLFWRDG